MGRSGIIGAGGAFGAGGAGGAGGAVGGVGGGGGVCAPAIAGVLNRTAIITVPIARFVVIDLSFRYDLFSRKSVRFTSCRSVIVR